MAPELSVCGDLFARDPVLYLDMTEPVRRGTGTVLAAFPDGALVEVSAQGGGDTVYSLSARNQEAARRLCAMIPASAVYVTAHETLSFPALQERFHYRGMNACWQVAYLDWAPLPLPDLGLELRPLEPVHLPLVEAHYKLVGGDYVAGVLSRGDLYGAFRGDALWGFIGRHPEGTVGLLEVFPEHRRQGVATLLQSYMVNLELERGHIPYGQVFDGNQASLALQRSLGVQCSRGQMYWPDF